jgi:pyrroloquinoline quinone (PQQ) biosynthesis protein C
MAKDSKTFTKELGAEIQDRNPLLLNDFWKAFYAGTLKRTTLREWVKQQYIHIAAFPQMLGRLFSMCPDLDFRKMLAENLAEEEIGLGQPADHLELFLRVVDGFKVPRKDALNAKPLPALTKLLKLERVLIDRSFLEGAAALNFALENAVPGPYGGPMLKAVKEVYRLPETAWVNFSLHGEVDVKHSAFGTQVLERYATTPAAQRRARTAAMSALDAYDGLWTALYRLDQRTN